MREEDSGLDCSPITGGGACQGPLGARALINALSDGVSNARRPEQGKRGEGKVTDNHEYAPRFGFEGNHLCTGLFFPPSLRLRFPPSVFEVSPPSPRLAPPTIEAHELLINLGDRKYIMALCCALTCLFCDGSALLPKGSAFECRSVNIILNIKIGGIQRITCRPSINDWWIPAASHHILNAFCHRQ